MHLLVEDPAVQERIPSRRRGEDADLTLEHMVRVSGRPRWVNKLRAAVLLFAARLINFRRFGGTWRVSLDRLETGDVRVVLSVLYLPFAEMDLDEWFRAKPDDTYFKQLTDHITQVKEDLEGEDPDGSRKVIVRSKADLKEAVDAKKVAIIHCVEGGFHLGPRKEEIGPRVAELAKCGVAYITLAHLFWRRVATNAPAIPFLPDWGYDAIFRQPRDEGLSELGVAAVEAMYEHGILIDVSHMRREALDDTFRELDRLDRKHRRKPQDYPVIATHAGYRFGFQDYMLKPDVIEKIAARDGVIGLIMARHQLYSGLGISFRHDLARTVKAMRRHIDAIHRVTGSHRHVAIGSDLDGFIKPTVHGIENVDDLGALEGPLRRLYPDDAEAILSGNGLRVVERAFAQRPG
jgi:microsomal dipeptidase-like Zn-dependent dipeptidase